MRTPHRVFLPLKLGAPIPICKPSVFRASGAWPCTLYRLFGSRFFLLVFTSRALNFAGSISFLLRLPPPQLTPPPHVFFGQDSSPLPDWRRRSLRLLLVSSCATSPFAAGRWDLGAGSSKPLPFLSLLGLKISSPDLFSLKVTRRHL